ncbi:hypothetical protein [Caenibius sp. WL]|uniref:hypothetical protein n=1 Tax=Caenibius sp. WL TaxID=2872646 RepID=UPI001C98FFC3|nr:hypothetical protein [Caenibius sp. WL]QZP08972.1 hypothetical protein K5X80_04105 [Caenibius sp. WL]
MAPLSAPWLFCLVRINHWFVSVAAKHHRRAAAMEQPFVQAVAETSIIGGSYHAFRIALADWRAYPAYPVAGLLHRASMR